MGIVIHFHWLVKNGQILYKLSSNIKHVFIECHLLQSRMQDGCHEQSLSDVGKPKTSDKASTSLTNLFKPLTRCISWLMFAVSVVVSVKINRSHYFCGTSWTSYSLLIFSAFKSVLISWNFTFWDLFNCH